MSGIGHNSATFGEEICEDVERILSDDRKKLFHYVQWHLADYITGTQGMSPEQEGIYMRFLVRLYDRGKPFPDDDRFMASIMSLDVRRWRRIKTDLVSFGKIIIRSGGLSNSRFEKERQKRAEDLRKQADGTRRHHEKRRQQKQSAQEDRPDFAPTSPRLREEVQPKCGEKTNEINGSGKHLTSQTRDQRPLAIKANGSLVNISSPTPEAPPPQIVPPEMKFRPREDGMLTFSEDFVRGPGFVLDLKACALEVQMCALPVERTPAIVEIIARDWVANKVRPKNPGTWFRNALVSRRNQSAIDQVRLQNGIKRAAQSPQAAQIDAAYERVMAKKKAREAVDG